MGLERLSNNAVRDRVAQLVGRHLLEFSRHVLSWPEAYAFFHGTATRGSTRDNRAMRANAKLTILKDQIEDAFVAHHITTNSAIGYYFGPTVHWVCNCFRRGYLTWGTGGRRGWTRIPLTPLVRGMMAAIDALTISPRSFDVAKRVVPHILNGCSNDVIATNLNMNVQVVEEARSAIARAAEQHSLQSVLLHGVMGDKEDVLSRTECMMVGLFVAGLTADSIAKEMAIDVASVRQTLSSLVRRQRLQRVNVHGLPQLQRRMVELATAGMNDTNVATDIGTDAKTVAITLTKLADRQALTALVKHIGARARWRAVLPRAMAGWSASRVAAEQVGDDAPPMNLRESRPVCGEILI